MPRLNIYLNDEAHELASRWKDRVSLSDICARAIRDELSALEDGREISQLTQNWQAPTMIEREIARKFGLQTAMVVEAEEDNQVDIRRQLGAAAAELIDGLVPDPCSIALCGGRQVWEVVRNLRRRNIRAEILAFGAELAESSIQHVNSNAMAIILSLIYQPRAVAKVVTSENAASVWTSNSTAAYKNRILIGSCSDVDEETEYYAEMGNGFFDDVKESGATGEFAYCFFGRDGKEVAVDYPRRVRAFATAGLKAWSRDNRSRVILVAGGITKRDSVLACVSEKMCDTLVTDTTTAEYILSGGNE